METVPPFKDVVGEVLSKYDAMIFVDDRPQRIDENVAKIRT